MTYEVFVAKNNPMNGGPIFVEALKYALEGRADGFARPPATGGTQISIRFSDDRLALFSILAERSGWNRTQVIDALIDGGLIILFDRLSDRAADEIIESRINAHMNALRK